MFFNYLIFIKYINTVNLSIQDSILDRQGPFEPILKSASRVAIRYGWYL